MATAKVGPTGYGGYGILWEGFRWMGDRGGYSGPFPTAPAAKEYARALAEAHPDNDDLTIEDVATVNPDL